MKLYELTENYQNLQELLENPDIPQEIIQKALDDVQGDITDKFENIAKLIKSIDADIKARKQEESRLKNGRAALENRKAHLQEYLETNLKALGKDKIKGKIFTLSIQKNAPSVNVVSLMDIPESYLVKQDPSVDKKLILECLKQGKEVPGAELKQTESLRIR